MEDNISDVCDNTLHASITNGIASEDTASLHYLNSLQKDSDEFRFIEKIGSGAFGTVWKAHDLLLDRKVAIKVVPNSELDDIEAALHEAKAVAGLQHPNIVRIFRVKPSSDLVLLINELIEGGNLLDLIRVSKPSFNQSAEICRSVALALDHAHSQGIVHRDVKPSNILIDQNNTPYLADFGIAKFMNTAVTIRQPDEFIGSIGYMAPEQSRNKTVDARSDIYSLGVVLYELLVGSPPFSGTPQEIILGHQFQPPDSLQTRNQTIPVDIETICLKAIEKRPGDRYQSAKLFAEDLERYLNQQPIIAKPPSVLRQFRYRIGVIARRPAVTISIFAVMTSLIAAMFVFPYEVHKTDYRNVKIRTGPDECYVFVHPVDSHGNPDPHRSSEISTSKSPTTLNLVPGHYRVIAKKNGYPTAEVNRYVPKAEENQPLSAAKTLFWSLSNHQPNGIEWMQIPLFDYFPTTKMVYFPGNNQIPAFFLSPQVCSVIEFRLTRNQLPRYFRDLEYNEHSPFWCNHMVATYNAEQLGFRMPTIHEIRYATEYLTSVKRSRGLNSPQESLLNSLLDQDREWTSTIRNFDPKNKSDVIGFYGDGRTVIEFDAKENLSPLTSRVAFRAARTAGVQ